MIGSYKLSARALSRFDSKEVVPPPKNNTIPSIIRPIIAMILMLANQNSLSPYKLTANILSATIVTLNHEKPTSIVPKTTHYDYGNPYSQWSVGGKASA